MIFSKDAVLDVHIVGGESDSIDMGAKIIEKIQSDKRLKLASCCLMTEEVRQLALDVRTGKIMYEFDESPYGESSSKLTDDKSQPIRDATPNKKLQNAKLMDKQTHLTTPALEGDKSDKANVSTQQPKA